MSNTLFEKLKNFVDLNRKEKSRPEERNFMGHDIVRAGMREMENWKWYSGKLWEAAGRAL